MQLSYKKPILQNAYLLNKQHSQTFKLPNTEILKIKFNQTHAKICCQAERFWVLIVEKKSKDTFIGIIDNELVNTQIHGLQYGDAVLFETQNIYQIIE